MARLGNRQAAVGQRADPWRHRSVAEGIVRLARLVGRENLIAGTDCGFAPGPFYRRVHPSIMWAKLEALAQGARLASAELWK